MDIKDFKENKNISNTNVYFYKDVYDNEVTVINGMFFYITPDPNDKTLTRECVDRLKDIIVNEYIPNTVIMFVFIYTKWKRLAKECAFLFWESQLN